MSPQVKKTAKIILLPIEGDSGHLYGMDNKTGSIIPFLLSRATMGTCYNEDILLVNKESNVPRIDSLNYSSERKILIEKASTNILSTATLEFADRTEYNDGYYQGYRLVANTLLNRHGVIYPTTTTATDYTSASVLIKYNGIKYVQLRLRSGGTDQWCIIDTQTGDVSQNIGGLNVSVTEVSNEWFKVDLSDSGSPSATAYLIIRLSITPTISEYIPQFLGNGVSGMYYAYPQVEKQTKPTSYIPVSSSAVTRSADLLSIELSKETNVEIQTTERLIEETKPSGIWNVDQDLNNEGIKYIAIY